MSDDLIAMHEGRDALGQSIQFQPTTVHSIHVYEVRPRKDHRGFDLISDVLPFGRLWYGEQMQLRAQSRHEKFFKFLKLGVLLNFSFSAFRIFP
jgi:hypothetical protein